ncbi:fructose-specific PTS transporter subunit EIIC [Sutcliffiella sp. NC1]|uniref:fructose-specific PTS transporter subunit EIIC n=1 Tax=Sutcliffiella sp. NC1 TaxID=3004096 RepID=UPI0022DD0C61|nr:fructose-specific PTS transporter subunit EIIC [Sutcliffiella sp. NC1]WBL14765.1 fructose-specific PTS transporter subunit EIIC [Sutcliffiella sp. NC1]
MELKKMTNENLLFLDATWSSKEQVLEHLVDALYENGNLNAKEPFLQAVLDREKLSPTGMEAGLAIPHGKSKAVKRAAFAVAKLRKPLTTWESLDPNNKVDLIFLLAIPDTEAGSTHLKLLSELSTRLMDPTYLQSLHAVKDKATFLKALDAVKQEKVTEPTIEGPRKKVLAITACAAGIAHTYMAAEALEKAGREMGVEVIVEKQGANGIEDKHTASLIKEADAVIFATDIAPKEMERFNGLPFIRTKVAEPLRKAKDMITRVLENPDGKVKEAEDTTTESSEKKGFFAEMGAAILTGISYMIPVIVSAGLMIGIAKLGAMPFGLVQEINQPEYANHTNQLLVILHHLDKFGGMIFKFMYPVFGAFVAYALANRPGLVSGFIGGAFAAGLHFTFWGVEGGVASGFLGALVLGLAAGYVSKIANEKIKLGKNFQAMKPMLIIPAISVLTIFFLNFYFVDPVFGALNAWLTNVIASAENSGALVLSSIIASATAFDLGGPINKAAGAIAIGLAADEIFPLTARVLAIVIPPIGLGLATVIDRYVVGRRVFDADLRVAGNTSLLLGFIAISEGAIPFMLRNPLITIPLNIIGAILGACTAVLLGAVQWYPLPAIWGWPLVENVWAYLIGLAVGAAFIAFSNIFIRFALLKRKERQATNSK